MAAFGVWDPACLRPSLLLRCVLRGLGSAKTTRPRISRQLPRERHVLPRHSVSSASLRFPHNIARCVTRELCLSHDLVFFTWNTNSLKTETLPVFTGNWPSLARPPGPRGFGRHCLCRPCLLLPASCPFSRGTLGERDVKSVFMYKVANESKGALGGFLFWTRRTVLSPVLFWSPDWVNAPSDRVTSSGDQLTLPSAGCGPGRCCSPSASFV